jgi:hypothetical protein
MEEEDKTGGIGPLELLSTRLNIHAACRAGMGRTAWAKKHSTWHDSWKYTAVDKAQQARPNGGRRGSRTISGGGTRCQRAICHSAASATFTGAFRNDGCETLQQTRWLTCHVVVRIDAC